MITLPTSAPNFLNLPQYDTSNFIHEIPKHTKKTQKKPQHIPIKTDALSHNQEWKINIWGKIYIVTSYEMM